MNIKSWTVPQNIERVVRFKVTDKTLTIQYITLHERTAQLTLSHNKIEEFLKKDVKTNSEPDECNTCGELTRKYISIQTEGLHEYNDQFSIHPHCYQHYKQAVTEIKEKYTNELVAHTV